MFRKTTCLLIVMHHLGTKSMRITGWTFVSFSSLTIVISVKGQKTVIFIDEMNYNLFADCHDLNDGIGIDDLSHKWNCFDLSWSSCTNSTKESKHSHWQKLSKVMHSSRGWFWENFCACNWLISRSHGTGAVKIKVMWERYSQCLKRVMKSKKMLIDFRFIIYTYKRADNMNWSKVTVSSALNISSRCHQHQYDWENIGMRQKTNLDKNLCHQHLWKYNYLIERGFW